MSTALFACSKCFSRHPFDELSQGQQLCKVSFQFTFTFTSFFVQIRTVITSVYGLTGELIKNKSSWWCHQNEQQVRNLSKLIIWVMCVGVTSNFNSMTLRLSEEFDHQFCICLYLVPCFLRARCHCSAGYKLKQFCLLSIIRYGLIWYQR